MMNTFQHILYIHLASQVIPKTVPKAARHLAKANHLNAALLQDNMMIRIAYQQ